MHSYQEVTIGCDNWCFSTCNRWRNINYRSGVERVYTGRTGSTLNGNQGGAANYVCMPDDPECTLWNLKQGYKEVITCMEPIVNNTTLDP
jgi:hypothetical protein